MNILSMLAESIRVANKLENADSRAGLESAERFTAKYCAPVREQISKSAGSGESEMINGAFMQLL